MEKKLMILKNVYYRNIFVILVPGEENSKDLLAKYFRIK